MTENQSEHHREQMEAIRRDFQTWWADYSKGKPWVENPSGILTHTAWHSWLAAKGITLPK